MWSEEKNVAGGVAILVTENLVDNVVQVESKNWRIMEVKIEIGREIGRIFSACPPHVGMAEGEREAFLGGLDVVAAIC